PTLDSARLCAMEVGRAGRGEVPTQRRAALRAWKFAALGRAKSAPERWTAGAPACWSDSPPAYTAPPARRPAPCLSARHARAVESARGRAPGAGAEFSRAAPCRAGAQPV